MATTTVNMTTVRAIRLGAELMIFDGLVVAIVGRKAKPITTNPGSLHRIPLFQSNVTYNLTTTNPYILKPDRV